MNINKALFPVSSTIKTISGMQKQMEKLQLQLATGKRYNSLAEIGQDRVHDLNIRARLSRIDGYQANIKTVETRLGFYTNSLQRLDDIEGDARALAVANAYGTDGINLVTVQQQATSMLREVVDLLNTDITGQYIFGGNKSDTQPLPNFDILMKGTTVPNQTGFHGVLDEYKDAHGVGALGRMTLANPTGSDTVNLASYDNALFGIRLDNAEASASIAVNGNAADGYSFVVSDDVAPLDELTITVKLPQDPNTEYTIKLVATEASPPGLGKFTIGADAAETAKNLHDALEGALEVFANGELSAATAKEAADAFFFSPPATSAKRIEFVAGEPQSYDGTQDTVLWYRGQQAGPNENPRHSVTVQIDEHTRAAYGVQANEYGLAELIRSLAMLSSEDMLMKPGSSVPGEQAEIDRHNASVAARYESLASGVRSRLSESNNNQPGSVEGILMELGLAANTINTVKSRHTQYGAQLQNMLADIESITVEEVAMQMLTLQTRLQASYQVTSMVSQLTLVNYLR